MPLRNLIIYGGTFDPIHYAHINTAKIIQQHFNFEQFLFLPCKTPVLKKNSGATSEQRLAMLKLALNDEKDDFGIDLSEINREGPSYMVDTLKDFRYRLGNDVAISLIMGADVFKQLPLWHEWQQLLPLTNLLVINRTGTTEADFPSNVLELLNSHKTTKADTLLSKSHGFIYRFDAGKFDITSTLLRKKIAENEDISAYVPPSVLNYIQQNKLYLRGTRQEKSHATLSPNPLPRKPSTSK